MEKDIEYKFLKSIYLCFIDIQFCHQIQIFGFDNPYQERPGAMPFDKRGRINGEEHYSSLSFSGNIEANSSSISIP